MLPLLPAGEFGSIEIKVEMSIHRSTTTNFNSLPLEPPTGSLAETKGAGAGAGAEGIECDSVIFVPTAPSPVAPAAMPDSLLVVRYGDGVVPPIAIPEVVSASSGGGGGATGSSSSSSSRIPCLPDYRQVLAESYSWLWYLGFNGIDPLVDDPTPVQDYLEMEFREHKQIASTIAAVHREQARRRAESDGGGETGKSSGDEGDGEGSDPLLHCPPSPRSPMPEAPTMPKRQQHFLVRRVDCPYPLEAIDAQIQALDDLLESVGKVMVDADDWVETSGNFFRPSVLKKQMHVQPLPTNLHMQVMAVRQHTQPDSDPHLVESVTCGCFSPHGLGNKKGGLFHFEEQLVREKEGLDEAKKLFNIAVGKSSGSLLSPIGTEADLLASIKNVSAGTLVLEIIIVYHFQ